MGSAKEYREFFLEMNRYFKENYVPIKRIDIEPNSSDSGIGRINNNQYDYLKGKKGIELLINLVERENKIRVGFFISTYENDDKQLYDHLEAKRSKIEQWFQKFDDDLLWDWDRKNGGKSSWIVNYINGFSCCNKSNWEDLFAEIEDRLVKFQKIFSVIRDTPEIAQLYEFNTDNSETYAILKYRPNNLPLD